jgi:uncharacterized protein
MLIDIDKIPKEGLKISKDFEFLNVDLIEENAVFLQPTHADVMIKKAGDEIWIKGRITTRLSFVCSRCLAPFEFPIDSKFDLIYLPEEFDEIREQLEDKDLNKLFYYKHHFDLREVVLEQLNLTFPFRPLCSENCQGICAVCGRIIKEGKCACVGKVTDPRLQKLKIFMREK